MVLYSFDPLISLRKTALLVAGDFTALTLFMVIGKLSHGHSLDAESVLKSTAPFLAGLLLSHPSHYFLPYLHSITIASSQSDLALCLKNINLESIQWLMLARFIAIVVLKGVAAACLS